MKPMSLLTACGIVVSLALAAPSRADQFSPKQHGQREQAARTQAGAAARGARPNVPRGDLRGDIASNARARNDAQRPPSYTNHP
ncbi:MULTISPECIES: hypothetical protein [Burkholderia]|uniref:DUF4148 domain-containing protein n=1 Tax=Burkholderia savannae TaxID=1637837 RepID=A0ABR5TH85_9BURK|nr:MULTISPECIES: hypothetical protein [Burkholderia]AOJ69028.1 hypothetical protein WS78_09870 [Burkholderia savannae]AOJ81020.1 hypothetical protein WS86_10620 [Burkholderia savannae]AOK47241.1 hypothetical protein WT60_10595 [Burkholderia sp. MSMB617WGS]KGS08698.1 hypothetical protein X946_294 [Burkholderia sp. ABCPW 111]KVG39530.1 hypothetical protein WS77_20250 [Burkholderia sp. MSMB0265]